MKADPVEEKYIDKDTGIWAIHPRIQKRHRTDLRLAAYLAEKYKKMRTVADLGCGAGRYCGIFKAYGQWPVIHGYEGTQDIAGVVYDDIMTIDLTKYRHVGMNYDLVLCLEVGEHIPPQHEQTFIDNVVQFVGRHLVLSWGVPGQGGTGHVNLKSNDYVIDELKGRGLRFERKATRFFRSISRLEWFKNTLMVFKR